MAETDWRHDEGADDDDDDDDVRSGRWADDDADEGEEGEHGGDEDACGAGGDGGDGKASGDDVAGGGGGGDGSRLTFRVRRRGGREVSGEMAWSAASARAEARVMKVMVVVVRAATTV